MRNRTLKQSVRLVLLTIVISGLSFLNLAHAQTGKQAIEMVTSYDGIKLRLSKDYPKKQAKAVLIVAHGLSNHLGLYDKFTKDLNKENIAVYRYDHRGHGLSGGKRGYVKSFFEMVDDMDVIVKKAKAENPKLPVFILGHSMGGHVAALYGTKNPGQVDGYILAAGVLRYHQMNFGWLPRPEDPESYISAIEAAHGTLNLPGLEDLKELSVAGDTLSLNEVSVSLINAFEGGLEYLRDNSRKFTDPVLLVSGDADLYVVPQDAIDFYQETNSTDNSLRLYSGIGHFLMNEEKGDIVTKDIADWIKRRF
ncbi:alpha/beta hydrolase [Pontibacter akesuensis]|uniref:Lysophospholipase, alpha-beta hydrolase superfamily n=1 Tax=Pontibacter akesuensis TaxID=388950 RepID=A0A1I7KQX6_9BACT|nr:alpha/beta hydrolase [Pontibacter akesuensis]GHA81268.1 lysophospholipase [Pontibacter akesuensis]SFU99808.1 Lysophospholipase, alpha-beta hydrolase superfamily [Pontibacter akesuensis]